MAKNRAKLNRASGPITRCDIGVPEEDKKQEGVEKVFEEIMVEASTLERKK